MPDAAVRRNPEVHCTQRLAYAGRLRQPPDTVIQLSSLTKSFGDRTLLDRVTWQIDDRERVGLSGPNGAGKTTLLRMLAGLEDADGGHDRQARRV